MPLSKLPTHARRTYGASFYAHGTELQLLHCTPQRVLPYTADAGWQFEVECVAPLWSLRLTIPSARSGWRCAHAAGTHTTCLSPMDEPARGHVSAHGRARRTRCCYAAPGGAPCIKVSGIICE